MAYKLVSFDNIDLPLADASQDVGTPEVDSSIINSIGPTYDYSGTRRKYARIMKISASGLIYGEPTYLVDDDGIYLADEDGNYTITGSAATDLRSKLQALRAKVGNVAKLRRLRLDTASTTEWINARLLAVDWKRKEDEKIMLANVTCKFESTMTQWRAETATTSTVNTTSGVNATLNISVGGDMPVFDPIIEIARTSGTITKVEFSVAALGVAWEWTGSLGASDKLIVDCGAKTVYKNTSDAYSGFALTLSHTTRGWYWLPMPAGSQTAIIKTTGGASTVTLTHYNQFA